MSQAQYRANGRPVSTRYRKFAPEYVATGFVGTQAVLNLGWTSNRKSANVIAHRLLSNVHCQKLIEKHVMEAKISADEVLEELSSMARAPIPQEKVSEAGKLKALELSGKALKLFVDKVEIEQNLDEIDLGADMVQIAQSLRNNPEFAAKVKERLELRERSQPKLA